MTTPAPRKVCILGTGFLAAYIARALAHHSPTSRILLASRSPYALHASLSPSLPPHTLLPPLSADLTRPQTLTLPFQNATCVINTVGLLTASPAQFALVQHLGAKHVALAARSANAHLIHISAIGAEPESHVPYWRTKGLGEQAVREVLGDQATIVRPSLVFAPGDSFFARFARLAHFLPFLPLFGGGTSLFQPIYAADLARFVALCAQRVSSPSIDAAVGGKTFEAGGPDVMTYKELMRLTLLYSKQRRLLLPLPFWLGSLQASVLERLPTSLFTVTRDQIEQLKYDNVVTEPGFAEFLEKFDEGGGKLKSVHEVLPTYL